VSAAVLTYGIILNAVLNPVRFTKNTEYTFFVFAVLFVIYITTNGAIGRGIKDRTYFRTEVILHLQFLLLLF